MVSDDDDAPPTDGSTRVGRAVAAFSAVGRGPGLLDADDEAGHISEPIPIYSIGEPQADSKPDTLLKRARRIGWRYLVFQGDTLNVADLKSPSGDRPELFRSDGLVQDIVASGKLAEKTVGDTSRYRIRLLDLSILGQAVLWLASKQDYHADRFFRLSSPSEELDPAEFLDRMSEAEKLKAAAFAKTMDEAGG